MITTANLKSYITSIEAFPEYTSIHDSPLLTSQKISTAYNIPASTGAGVKVGIISLGGGFNQSDLNRSMADMGLTAPTITFVGVDGTTNTYTGNPNSADGENALDLVCVAGMVPQANIVLYKGNNDSPAYFSSNPATAATLNANHSFANTIQRAIDENCDIITISWGSNEIYSNVYYNYYCGDYLASTFANAAAKGITVCVSAGDYGSENNIAANVITADYPATNANVVVVGGTYLTLNSDNTRLNETVYNQSEAGYPAGFAGGGGISSFVSAPTWQQGLTYQKWFKSNSSAGPVTSLTNRGEPDIAAAMNAYGVWINGTIYGFSGTSASSPIMAGIFARIRALTGNKLSSPQINSILYQNLNAFYDINTGNDDSLLSTGYVASIGWDPVTGLGVPIGTALLAAVQKYINATPYQPKIKYNLGVTYVKNSSGAYKPLVNALIKTDSVTWTPIKTGWVKVNNTTWERIYPTPRGVLTPAVTSLTFNPYQHHTDPLKDIGPVAPPYELTVTNTGDYDLVIDNVVVNDSTGNYQSVDIGIGFTAPTTLVPGQSTNFSLRAFGNVVGNGYTGNITFYNDIGYLGTSNVVIPVTVNVLPDYAEITVTPNPAQVSYYVDPTPITASYTSPGSYSYVVPSGATKLNLTVVGGGGGGGGYDACPGHSGYPGRIVSGTLTVTPGDTIGIYVGGGGGYGSSGGGASGGGGGYSADSYSGGAGSASGPIPWSGAGGGGGGATVVTQNSTVIIVAGGGGGGGGGGCNSSGQGQQAYSSSGSTTGGDGTYKSGDGGGAGGGGGGHSGGAGGALQGGDNGGFSGSDGADLLPTGFVSTKGANAGGPSAAGGSGSVNLSTNKTLSGTTKTITIFNSGNGANLVIANITSSLGSVATGLTANSIGYNFTTFTGNTATFTATAANLDVGTHTDILSITSNAQTSPTYNLPLVITVLPPPNGTKVFTTSGTSTFTVPDGVHYIDIGLVGGGGGFGSGYDGGAGSFVTYKNLLVSPGDTLSVTVGAGGQSSVYSSVQYYPVSLSWAWGSFINSYGVWSSPDQESPVGSTVTSYRLFVAPYTGSYTITYSADNSLTMYIDGTQVLSTGSDSTFTGSYSTTVTMSQGNRSLRFDAYNEGGPAGFAVTISDGSDNLLWNTRQELNPSSGTNGGTSSISGNFGKYTATGGVANSNSLINNGFSLVDGSAIYGPYGTGASSQAPGNPGAVMITWGQGDSKSAYYKYPVTVSASSGGAGSGGIGPNGVPGYQYSTTGGNATYIPTYSPVSRYYIANSTGDSSFAWSRAIAFVSTQTNITKDEMRAWGFDPTDVAAASSIEFINFAASVNAFIEVGWALIDHGAASLAQSHGYSTICALADSIADRHYRSSSSNPYSGSDNGGVSPYGLGPWTIPVPSPNQLLYFWTYDEIGTDSRSITVTYTT